MGKEVDPEKQVVKVETLPDGRRNICRRCPVCHKEIYDLEGELTGFIAHLSIHKLRVKQ